MFTLGTLKQVKISFPICEYFQIQLDEDQTPRHYVKKEKKEGRKAGKERRNSKMRIFFIVEWLLVNYLNLLPFNLFI